MIEYCLESIHCDPDVEIKLNDISKTSQVESDEEEETVEPMDTTLDEESVSKPKETSIFSLLRTISFVDNSIKHPLEIFLKKTQNINVIHNKTKRTPLLQSIYLQEYKTTHMLINQSSCDINLSTSILSNERQQTPLILACKLQYLLIIRDLLNNSQCNLLDYDDQHNQALHYYLANSKRSDKYLEIFYLFIEKLKLIGKDTLNNQGKSDCTPLHIAVYHNLGTIDAITDIEKVLIENGSNLLMKDNLGNLPLHNVFLPNKNVVF